jgi:hypothetical protein
MKLIQAMIKLCTSIMITSLVCVVCTFTVMNAYVDMILDQYELKSATLAAPNWSQFLAHLGKQAEGYRLFGEAKVAEGGSLGLLPPKAAVSTIRDTPQEDAIAVFGQQKETEKDAVPKNVEPKNVVPKNTETKSTEPKNVESAASASTAGRASVSGGTLESGTPSLPSVGAANSGSGNGAGGKVVVSGEEFTKKKEQLSNEDKNQIFKLLTRVPQAEIQHISLMMEDGITASELTNIEQLLQNYLKPEEYSQLLSMINPR